MDIFAKASQNGSTGAHISERSPNAMNFLHRLAPPRFSPLWFVYGLVFAALVAAALCAHLYYLQDWSATIAWRRVLLALGLSAVIHLPGWLGAQAALAVRRRRRGDRRLFARPVHPGRHGRLGGSDRRADHAVHHRHRVGRRRGGGDLAGSVEMVPEKQKPRLIRRSLRFLRKARPFVFFGSDRMRG